LDDIIDIIAVTQLDGLIATNTTIDRSSLTSDTASIGAGGLSGKPLFDKSIEVIKYLHQQSQGRFPIIGVGGITSANDALKMLDAGASLVQVYSGLVYAGPGLVKDINKLLLS
jgi:dihydroorotate dehydrogenase